MRLVAEIVAAALHSDVFYDGAARGPRESCWTVDMSVRPTHTNYVVHIHSPSMIHSRSMIVL